MSEWIQTYKERPMRKVKALTKRTMMLEQLQKRALVICRKVRKQFRRSHYQHGMTDYEFIEDVLEPFMHEIMCDQYMLKQKGSER